MSAPAVYTRWRNTPDFARWITLDAGLIAAGFGSVVLTHSGVTQLPDAWRSNVAVVSCIVWYLVLTAAWIGHALRKQRVTLATTLFLGFAMMLCVVVLARSAPMVDPPSDEPANQRLITFDMAE